MRGGMRMTIKALEKGNDDMLTKDDDSGRINPRLKDESASSSIAS